MDDPLRLGALHPIGIDVAHYIVPDLPLACLGHIIIDVLCVGLKLGNLLVGDVEPLRLLGAGQCDPELSPCAELHVRRKKILHLVAGIAR